MRPAQCPGRLHHQTAWSRRCRDGAATALAHASSKQNLMVPKVAAYPGEYVVLQGSGWVLKRDTGHQKTLVPHWPGWSPHRGVWSRPAPICLSLALYWRLAHS